MNFRFSIADFRLRRKEIDTRRRSSFVSPDSDDNPKSKTCPEPYRRIKNRKWAGRFAIVVALVATATVAQAQQATKLPRIGYLLPGNPASESTVSQATRLALRELGYIEGQNIATEYRYAEGKRDRFPELAAELVRLKVDVLVVAGRNTPVRAVKNATKTIPIVMAGGSDPVKAGLVESLARPGANVTGLTNLARELGGKRLELLTKKPFPNLPVSRFSTMWSILPMYAR